MPFQSPAQKKLIYYRASQGTPWAKKFLRDSGVTDLPPVKRKKRKVKRK